MLGAFRCARRAGLLHGFRKMPSTPRMKIRGTAPASATMKRRTPPMGSIPSARASQSPSSEPDTPTMTLATNPIFALV